MNIPKELQGKIDELIGELAKQLAPDGGKALKDELESIFKKEGLPINKQTYRAFGEGLNFAWALYNTKEEKRAKDIMMLAMSFVKLFESESKN